MAQWGFLGCERRRGCARIGGAGCGVVVVLGVLRDAEKFVGEAGQIDFDFEIFADAEEDVGEGFGAVGVGREVVVDAGGGFPDQFGAVGGFVRGAGGDGVQLF